MPKVKEKKQAYKHKSGSDKLKIKQQKELRSAAEEKGQTKLNFGSLAHQVIPAGSTNDNESATCSKVEPESESDREALDDDNSVEESEQHGVPIGNFIPPNIEDALGVKMLFLEKHPVQPPPNTCQLPFNSTKIYFRDVPGSDSVQRKWLSYAEHSKAIHCAVCMAFGKDRENAFVLGVKIDVKSIYNKVHKHEESDSHRFAVDAYLRVDKNQCFDSLLKSQRLQEIETNRLILRRIIDIILCLAKQDISYRGHRFEAAHHMDDSNSDIGNQGNFLAIVRLVAKYDPILDAHVKRSTLNSRAMLEKRKKSNSAKINPGRGNLVTFLSKTTVNKIVNIIGQEISASIAKEVNLAKDFSLEVDSTQDVSITDQLSVCVRYVLNGEVKERLIKMLAQHSSTGEAQYNLLKTELSLLGIDLKYLVSDSFDGAANMKGAYRGLQSILKRDAPNSVFTHCHAHVLNLVIGDATMKVIPAQDLFDLIQKTAVFFSNSYKRTDLWKRLLSNSCNGHEKQRRLQKLGATRWNSKHAALQAIFHTTVTPNEDRNRYANLVEALHSLGYHEAVDAATATEARNYLDKWTRFDTILTSLIFLHIFEASTPVSKYLQTKGLDYIAAWNQVAALREKMASLSTQFECIYEEAKEFASVMILKTEDLEHVSITTKLAEKRKRQKKLMPGEVARDESGDLDTKTRYRIDTFVSVMDQIQASLRNRFEDNEDLIKSFAYMDPQRFIDIRSGALSLQDKNAVDALLRIASLAKVDSEHLVQELKEFATSYESLSLALHAEFKISTMDQNSILDDDYDGSDDDDAPDLTVPLVQKPNCKYCIPCAFRLLHKYNFHSSAFSTIYRAYKFLLTMACTQVNCERSFSKLKIIKTRLRSTMSQNLLESLLLISIESDMIPGTDNIMDNLARSSSLLTRKLLI